MGIFGWGRNSRNSNSFMPDNEVTRMLGINTELIVCQSEEELQQKAEHTKELTQKAEWTEKYVDHSIEDIHSNKKIALANLKRYEAEAEAIGEISEAVGKTMGSAGKAAGKMVKGAAKTQQAVSRFQQRSNDIAARLSGANGNRSLPSSNNLPRLKAW